MFVPLQQRDGKPLVFVNSDQICLIHDEGNTGSRITFAAGCDMEIDRTSTDKLLGKLEVAAYKAR